MKKLLALVLALVLVLSAASVSMAEEEPIVLHVGKQLNVASVSLPEGHTVEDNNYSLQYIKERYNIEIVYDWLLADQEQKVSLVLASGEMPDAMKVNYTDYSHLLESGMLADLTDAFNAVIPGTILEETFKLYPESIDMVTTADGKLMAVPNQGGKFANGMLWIRLDWLKNLGLEVPTTLDELENVIRAFVEDDPDGNGEADTIGLALTDKNMLTADGYMNYLNLCATIFGTFPGTWYLNDEGNVVYGSVEQGTRDMLELLAKWYAEGLIDPEFAARDDSELIVSGKCGVTAGPWYASGGTLGQSWTFDGADWQPILCPLNEDGNYLARASVPATEFIVVSKNCQNLEAIFETLVASYEFHWSMNLSDEWLEKRNEYSAVGYDWAIMPLAVVFNAGYSTADRNAAFVSYIDDGVYPEDASAEIKGYLGEYITYEQDPTHMQGWAWYKGMYFAYGLDLQDNIKYTAPCFNGTTETMADCWTTLQTMENETFLKIVLGTAPIEEFDNFVDQWYKLGGEKIISEIEAIVG